MTELSMPTISFVYYIGVRVDQRVFTGLKRWNALVLVSNKKMSSLFKMSTNQLNRNLKLMFTKKTVETIC